MRFHRIRDGVSSRQKHLKTQRLHGILKPKRIILGERNLTPLPAKRNITSTTKKNDSLEFVEKKLSHPPPKKYTKKNIENQGELPQFNTVDGRNPAPLSIDSLSYNLQGFIHPRCFFTTKQQHTAVKFLPRTRKAAFHLRGFNEKD